MNIQDEKWSKQDREAIWKHYIEIKVYNIFEEESLQEFDFQKEAPCPDCGKPMYKTQYQEEKPNRPGSWNVYRIDQNIQNNKITNLQPIHPWCIKKTSTD